MVKYLAAGVLLMCTAVPCLAGELDKIREAFTDSINAVNREQRLKEATERLEKIAADLKAEMEKAKSKQAKVKKDCPCKPGCECGCEVTGVCDCPGSKNHKESKSKTAPATSERHTTNGLQVKAKVQQEEQTDSLANGDDPILYQLNAYGQMVPTGERLSQYRAMMQRQGQQIQTTQSLPQRSVQYGVVQPTYSYSYPVSYGYYQPTYYSQPVTYQRQYATPVRNFLGNVFSGSAPVSSGRAASC